MGYRPTIICGKTEIMLGKFYGYIDGLMELESIKWLIKKKKVDDSGLIKFDWCPEGPEITFTADEFREYIDLYEKDINNTDFTKTHIDYYPKPYNLLKIYPKLKRIYKNNKPKTIEWG